MTVRHGGYVGPILEGLAEIANVAGDVLVTLYRKGNDGLKAEVGKS